LLLLLLLLSLRCWSSSAMLLCVTLHRRWPSLLRRCLCYTVYRETRHQRASASVGSEAV
jgi:hypothetical protein